MAHASPSLPVDTIEVMLEGNATTGFTWELVDLDATVIAAEGDPAYEVEDSELVGAGGTWTWTLVAQRPGGCIVRFAYHRAWEDEQPEATFSFTADVVE
jgi:predicted secreted protein